MTVCEAVYGDDWVRNISQKAFRFHQKNCNKVLPQMFKGIKINKAYLGSTKDFSGKRPSSRMSIDTDLCKTKLLVSLAVKLKAVKDLVF